MVLPSRQRVFWSGAVGDWLEPGFLEAPAAFAMAPTMLFSAAASLLVSIFEVA